MKICCIKTTSIPNEIKKATGSFSVNYSDFINDTDIVWIERQEAENDKNFNQLIPYVIVMDADEKIACYERHGNEKRLHGKISCGVGGHIDETDKAESFTQTMTNGMYRELCEELKNFDKSKVNFSYLGIINEIESEVGEVHLGIVFLIKCNQGYTPEANSELKNMKWKSKEEIQSCNTELWSGLALRLLKNQTKENV